MTEKKQEKAAESSRIRRSKSASLRSNDRLRPFDPFARMDDSSDGSLAGRCRVDGPLGPGMRHRYIVEDVERSTVLGRIDDVDRLAVGLAGEDQVRADRDHLAVLPVEALTLDELTARAPLAQYSHRLHPLANALERQPGQFDFAIVEFQAADRRQHRQPVLVADTLDAADVLVLVPVRTVRAPQRELQGTVGDRHVHHPERTVAPEDHARLETDRRREVDVQTADRAPGSERPTASLAPPRSDEVVRSTFFVVDLDPLERREGVIRDGVRLSITRRDQNDLDQIGVARAFVRESDLCLIQVQPGLALTTALLQRDDERLVRH